jgi:hypothetical protein
MNASTCVISKSLNKTRKHWLFSTFSFLILYPLALALFSFFTDLSERIAISEDALIELLAYAFGGVIPMWMIWHCAYRKHGTRLLTFWLFVSPLQMLGAIVESCNSRTLIFLLLNLAIFLWRLFMSIKMKAINKMIQERISLKNAEPKQA